MKRLRFGETFWAELGDDLEWQSPVASVTQALNEWTERELQKRPMKNSKQYIFNRAVSEFCPVSYQDDEGEC